MLISELRPGSVTSTKGRSCCFCLYLVLVLAADRRGLIQQPCLESSRLDDWFFGVDCAGSQHPAQGASLPDVHEELTGRGRHLLLPETDLLTPPPSPPSVVQLGVYGGPPGGAVSCDASVSLYCLHPAGQTVCPLPGL